MLAAYWDVAPVPPSGGLLVYFGENKQACSTKMLLTVTESLLFYQARSAFQSSDLARAPRAGRDSTVLIPVYT